MNRLYYIIAIMAITLAATGCRSSGNDLTIPVDDPHIDLATVAADNWNAFETATFAVTWTGTTGPFTVAVDVGTAESVPAGTAAGMSPFTWDFTLEEGATFNWTVTVTDAIGYSDTETGTYGPVTTTPNAAPEIVSAVYDAGRLTVTVSDAEDDDVTVAYTDVDGLTGHPAYTIIVGGNGTAEFTWSPDDFFVGGSGYTTVTAWDARHADDPATTAVYIELIPITDPLPEGQLGAIPLQTTATVGETVTVLVAASDFPAGAAFAFLTGVAVTFEDGGEYVADTFNIGSIGGDTFEVDGIWATMDPQPQTFFHPTDMLIMATDVDADSNLDFLPFAVTPVGAGEVTNGGDLFNFGISFDHAGVYHLGFLEFQDVKRTFYKDGNGTEYNWTDIDNELTVSTAITVTE